MEQVRNFKDFLQLYNQISDTCFTRCTNSLFSRELEPDEVQCVDRCAQKFIRTNHRIMEIYMELQAVIMQRRMNEMNMAQAALELKNQGQNDEAIK